MQGYESFTAPLPSRRQRGKSGAARGRPAQ
jgi:hypothetical protein